MNRPAVIIREEKSVGFSFIDGIDNLILIQHPTNDESIRSLVWCIWRNKHPKEWNDFIKEEEARTGGTDELLE